MVYDIPKAIEALANAVTKAFSFAEEAKEHQSETKVLRDAKEYKRAINYAEKIINVSYKYFEVMDPKDRKLLAKLIKNFQKYN